jgi:UTP--glucose-1-phosphate uridylyltransferase
MESVFPPVAGSFVTASAVNPIQTAIIPVAGLGTRTFPASYGVPKNLLPAGDRPLIQHAVEEALEAGASRIVIVCNPGEAGLFQRQFRKDPALELRLAQDGKTELFDMVQRLGKLGDKITYVEQAEALGLGHAVLQGKPYINGKPFAVILPDDHFCPDPGKRSGLAQMADLYKQAGGNVIWAMEVAAEDTKRYGVFRAAPGAQDGALTESTGVVEKPKTPDEVNGSRLAIMGRYILQPEVMGLIETTPRGAGGEYQITDAINRVGEVGQKIHAAQLKGVRLDYGTLDGRRKAEVFLAQRANPATVDSAVRLASGM